MLHKLLLSSIALIGLTGFASAADLYVKAAPIYVSTWTGCYLGGRAAGRLDQVHGADRLKAISAAAVEPGPRGVPFSICSPTSTIHNVPKIATI
jgi:hypothetical protein